MNIKELCQWLDYLAVSGELIAICIQRAFFVEFVLKRAQVEA